MSERDTHLNNERDTTMPEVLLQNVTFGTPHHVDVLVGSYDTDAEAKTRLLVHLSEGGWWEWQSGTLERPDGRFTITLYRTAVSASQSRN